MRINITLQLSKAHASVKSTHIIDPYLYRDFYLIMIKYGQSYMNGNDSADNKG
jgi:hypothetical protein